MPTHLSRERFQTLAGRKTAWRALMLEDHGLLRKIYDNSHPVGAEMWRSYQPSPKDISNWQEKGIKTIINLRGWIEHRGGEQPGFYWLEEEAAKAHGLDFVNFRAFSREAPSKAFIKGIDKLFQEITYPAMMHCKSGADRAGLASTLYLFLKEERPLEEALDQLSYRYGHVKSGKTGVLDHFFDTYKKAATTDGVTPNRAHFLNWAENDYDQAAVQQSFTPGKLGSLLTEVILRRE